MHRENLGEGRVGLRNGGRKPGIPENGNFSGELSSGRDGGSWRLAIHLARREKRLWPAAILLSVGLSESWRVLFGWEPQGVGETAARWVRSGAGKGFPDAAVLVLVSLTIFVFLRAGGYLGEAVLIRQIAGSGGAAGGNSPPGYGVGAPGGPPSRMGREEGKGGASRAEPGGIHSGEVETFFWIDRMPGAERGNEVRFGGAEETAAECGRALFGAPGEEFASSEKRGVDLTFKDALRRSRKRLPELALTLLPWDAARVAVVSLASLLVLLWGRWDPHLHLIFPYLLALFLWLVLLLAVYVPLGIPVILAARQVVINGMKPPQAWREGWSLFRNETPRCLLVWLQALAADVAFLALASPLSLLLIWAAARAAEALNPSILEWLARAPLYLILAAALLLGQVVTKTYKSSLWTIFFLSRSSSAPVVS
jgi:hypothetical protein